ncbi:MAG TPA: hypothetical protein VFV86_07360 [Nitrososphaeraceae archaeon]|nr:hypothetical protein [Nitrososphaeraceae archaeon]
MQLTGDVGSTPSAAIAVNILFGVLFDRYLQYDVEDVDKEPTSFQYFLAQNYKGKLAKMINQKKNPV